MQKTPRNAAHEVGHFILAKHHDVAVKHLILYEGDAAIPAIRLAEGFELSSEANIEFSLAGWAGEAYLRSHNRDAREFRAWRFALATRLSGKGSGWRYGLNGHGISDIAQLVQVGVPLEELSRPHGRLLTIGTILHERRVQFYGTIDRLLEKSFLGSEALSAVWRNEPWTAEIERANNNAEFQALADGELFIRNSG